jgi:hypothetical protein
LKRIADIDPEILAKIFGGKTASVAPPEGSKSGLSARQCFLHEKAFEEEGICLDFFPSASKADVQKGAEDGS